MKSVKFIYIVVVIMMIPSSVFAGGAVMRRQQMPQAQVQQAQQMQQQKMQAQQATHEQLLLQQNEIGAPDEEIEADVLWEELAVSSEIWMRIVDRQVKGLIVQTYIDWYKEQGIVITRSVVDYMLLLDHLALNNPGLFEQSFQNVLMFAAVMEYDFDNGTNKDQLAQKVLGPQLYEFNVKRLRGY